MADQQVAQSADMTLIDVADFLPLVGAGQAALRVVHTPGGDMIVAAFRLADGASAIAQAHFRDSREGSASRYTGRIKASQVDATANMVTVGNLTYQVAATVSLLDDSPVGVAAARRAARTAVARQNARLGRATLAEAQAEVVAAAPPPVTRNQLRQQLAKGEITPDAFAVAYASAPDA